MGEGVDSFFEFIKIVWRDKRCFHHAFFGEINTCIVCTDDINKVEKVFSCVGYRNYLCHMIVVYIKVYTCVNIAKRDQFPHTNGMSEMGERPQQPMPEDMSRQTRLEDLPEFQKLVPEEQQRLLAMGERLIGDVIKPQVDILERTAGLGIVGAMKEAVLPHMKKMGEIQFKNFKASAMAAISVIPMVSQGASFARATEKAGRFERASVKAAGKVEKMGMKAPEKLIKKMNIKYAKAMNAQKNVNSMIGTMANYEAQWFKSFVSKGIPQEIAYKAVNWPIKNLDIFRKELDSGVHYAKAFAHASKGIDTTAGALFKAPLIGEVTKGGLKYGARIGAERIAETWFHKTLHTLDPYPDVPGLVSMVGFLDLIPGVVGAELVPAAWQLVVNKIQMGKEYIGLSKDASKVILSRMGIKFNRLKDNDVVKAAEAFSPAVARGVV